MPPVFLTSIVTLKVPSEPTVLLSQTVSVSTLPAPEPLRGHNGSLNGIGILVAWRGSLLYFILQKAKHGNQVKTVALGKKLPDEEGEATVGVA